MWTRRGAGLVVLALAAAGVTLLAPPHVVSQLQAPPTNKLPAAPMQAKAEKACLGCHNASIILQQQLNEKVWTKEIDKMIRWGAPVAPEDRQAMIDYFAEYFEPRDPAAMAAKLPPGPGKEKVVEACFDCHDYHNITAQHLDEAGWERILEKMEDMGAYIYDDEREDIIQYLAKSFPPQPKPSQDPK